jgi:hypothetical protein
MLLLLFASTGFAGAAAEDAMPNGHAVIRGPAGDSEIVITTTARVAGAIHSLTWDGKEFIDSFDHGRQLQSAANFDCGTQFTSETFNPTEAGSRRDGAGESSSSRLLHMVTAGDALQTTSQMAFWLAPGETSAGNPAKNTQVLSNHLLTKRVRIGYEDMPHVIEYDVTFSVPIGENHTYAHLRDRRRFGDGPAVAPRIAREVHRRSRDTTDSSLIRFPGAKERPWFGRTEPGAQGAGSLRPHSRHAGHDAGADRAPSFADGEARAGFNGDRLLQADFDLDRVARETHLRVAEQPGLARHVRGAEVKLRSK